jgi:polyhydroxybutyrate depolymerase
MLHGYGSSAAGHESYLNFTALSDEKTFLYAYPDGLTDVAGQQFWNATDACCNIYDKPVDDVYFASAILADVQSSWPVDPRRIFVFGHSNGGFMAHRLACDLSETLAGVVSLAGMTWKDASKCPAKERIAILQIHGDADGNIKYGGGNVGAPWMASYPSARETVAHWAAADGCGALQATGETLDLDSKLAGNETAIERYAGCAGGAVELWTVRGGPHMPRLTPAWSRPVWDFLSAHPKP